MVWCRIQLIQNKTFWHGCWGLRSVPLPTLGLYSLPSSPKSFNTQLSTFSLHPLPSPLWKIHFFSFPKTSLSGAHMTTPSLHLGLNSSFISWQRTCALIWTKLVALLLRAPCHCSISIRLSISNHNRKALREPLSWSLLSPLQKTWYFPPPPPSSSPTSTTVMNECISPFNYLLSS